MMRHRLTLEAPVRTPDGAGGATLAWSPVASLWAEIEPAGHQERFRNEKTGAMVSHRISMRFRTDMVPGMRLVKGSRVFEVVSLLDPEERGRQLLCFATEQLTP